MLNVIVVDDESRLRRGIAKLLSQPERNVRVTGSFANGLLAYEYMMQHPPGEVDLVITDIKMPVMDGLKLIAGVRRERPTADFVILSGFGDFEYARQAMKYGVTDYLLKPIVLQELDQTLAKYARRKAQKAQPATESPNANPLQPLQERSEKSGNRLVETVKSYIHKHYSQEISLKQLADAAYVTPYHLSREFHREAGMTITDYMIQARITRAKQLLELQPQMKVFEIAEYVGYPNAAYFNKLFKKTVGVTPKEYQDKLVSETEA